MMAVRYVCLTLLAARSFASLSLRRTSVTARHPRSLYDRHQSLMDRVRVFQRHAASTGAGVDILTVSDDAQLGDASRVPRRVIWVNGFPRSGSSTLLSMVSVQSRVGSFALFEPCHDGDSVDATLQSQGCKGLLQDLANCRFDHVKDLWGWRDPHTTSNHTNFEAGEAHDICSTARRVAFKTVDYGHNATSWIELLDSQPDLYILAAVRDPRGVFASWKALEPFATLVKEGNFYTLDDVCRTYANNLNFSHPRVKQVLFEHMVEHPFDLTRDVYEFIGHAYGHSQEEWVRSNFNNGDCPTPPEWQVGFDDCRKDSSEIAIKWQRVLSEEEQAQFNSNPHCMAVKDFYGLDA